MKPLGLLRLVILAGLCLLPSGACSAEIVDSLFNDATRFSGWDFEMPAARVGFPAGVRSVTLPLEVFRHRAFVQVRVNGSEPLQFLLDTGRATTVISERVAGLLGLVELGKVQVTGDSGATDERPVWMVDSLRLGGVSVGPLPVVSHGTRSLERSIRQDVHGLLGWDVLSHFSVSVDLGRGSLTLTDTAVARPPVGAFVLPFEPGFEVPVVQATYDRKYVGRFRVNTAGSYYLLLNGPFVREKKIWRGGFRDVSLNFVGLVGSRSAYVLRQRPLKLARLVRDCPWVAAFHPEPGDSAEDPGVDGVIGEATLEAMEFTLDGPRHMLYVWAAAEGDSPDRIGWSVAERDGQLVVTSVVPAGPAANAGALPEDVLVRLNGMDLAGLSPSTLRRIADRPEGTMVRFRIMRQGETKDLDVLLSDPVK